MVFLAWCTEYHHFVQFVLGPPLNRKVLSPFPCRHPFYPAWPSHFQVVDTCLRKILIDRDVQGAIHYSKQARFNDNFEVFVNQRIIRQGFQFELLSARTAKGLCLSGLGYFGAVVILCCILFYRATVVF